jgi:hypothetical protein
MPAVQEGRSIREADGRVDWDHKAVFQMRWVQGSERSENDFQDMIKELVLQHGFMMMGKCSGFLYHPDEAPCANDKRSGSRKCPR